MESEDLRKAGLKVTHPRTRILELLETTGVRHMSAEDIYRQLINSGEEIGLATVYRVLTQFEAAGLVLKHNFEGGQAVYEMDRGKHHEYQRDQEFWIRYAPTCTRTWPDEWEPALRALTMTSPRRKTR